MKKFKIRSSILWITIIALLMLAGVIAFLTLYDHNPKNCYKYSDSENRDYLIEFEQVCKQMTEDQRRTFKQDGEKILNEIELELKSDSLNPEERFDKLRSKRLIKEELEIINRYLK